MSLSAYLIVAAVLLVIGLAMVASRRSLIHVLIGLELVLNASALNFVAFGRYAGEGVDGQLAALFVIVV
ncbi:MAG TPA: NADH-quinone oxidoreductase subunit NuoK, partial [Planctomycetes bacterium]|nr:NADH-quinone oxidoreductase subunit NuoK [Planctomycetota bacterium]